MTDLVRLSLRMRPDRILVGEVRGPEALDLLMAWNTGHEGGIATLHSNSAESGVATGLNRMARTGSRHRKFMPSFRCATASCQPGVQLFHPDLRDTQHESDESER